jgi:hypothetical protein
MAVALNVSFVAIHLRKIMPELSPGTHALVEACEMTSNY